MSFFKSSFRWYAAQQKFPYSAEQLQQALESHHHTSIGTSIDTMTWCSPYGDNNPLWVHTHNHCLWLCAQREQRILPSTVVRQAVEEKIKEIEEKEVRTLSKRERYQLKEDIYNRMLNQAFVKKSKLFAMIDTKSNLCFISTSQSRQADQWTELLHKTLGNLSFVLPKTQTKPSQAMTHWLANDACPTPFVIERHCELQQEVENGSKIRVSNTELMISPIETLLNQQHMVTKLGLRWQDRIQFTLNQDHTITQMKSLESLDSEITHEQDNASNMAQLTADFAIASELLTSLTQAIIQALGGLSIETHNEERETINA